MDARLESAWTRRAALHASLDTDAYRLIHRAADGFPALAVDRFGEVLVAQLYDEGARRRPPESVLRALAKRLNARAIYVKHRPAQASVLSVAERAALAPSTPWWGSAVEETVVHENGLAFSIRPGEGLSVGLFLDMRELRRWVRAQAAGKTVLNCFAYTCAFGVAALAGGAVRAVNVDVSRAYLNWGERNYELNGFAPDRHDFIAGDVFDWLSRFGRRGQTFDVVIVDPPSYSRTKQRRFSVERNFTELTALAAGVVAPGGWLIACANAAERPLGAFKKKVRAGLEGHPARLNTVAHEPEADFPVAPDAAPYLKIARVRFDAP
jgi:23S rRNA (cytosine1962-C5)-methyltransferase